MKHEARLDAGVRDETRQSIVVLSIKFGLIVGLAYQAEGSCAPPRPGECHAINARGTALLPLDGVRAWLQQRRA